MDDILLEVEELTLGDREIYLSEEALNTGLNILDNILDEGICQARVVALEEIGILDKDPMYPTFAYTQEPSDVNLFPALENILSKVGYAIKEGASKVAEFFKKIFNWIVEKIKGLFGSTKDGDSAVDSVNEKRDDAEDAMKEIESASDDVTEEVKKEMADSTPIKTMAKIAPEIKMLVENLDGIKKIGTDISEAAILLGDAYDSEVIIAKEFGTIKNRTDIDKLTKASDKLDEHYKQKWIELFGKAFTHMGFLKAETIATFEKTEKGEERGSDAGTGLQQLTDEYFKVYKFVNEEDISPEDFMEKEIDWAIKTDITEFKNVRKAFEKIQKSSEKAVKAFGDKSIQGKEREANLKGMEGSDADALRKASRAYNDRMVGLRKAATSVGKQSSMFMKMTHALYKFVKAQDQVLNDVIAAAK